MKDTRIKAYLVNSDWAEDNTSIQFARHAITARVNGLSDLNCDTDCLSGSRCNRAPQLDQYGSAGDVPVWLLVEMGWWGFECSGCGLEFSEDSLDEENKNITDIVGDYGGECYCDLACQDDHNRHLHEKRNFEAIEIDRIKAELEVAHPKGIVYVEDKQHFYATKKLGGWKIVQAIIHFRFPESTVGTCTANVTEAEPNMHVLIPQGDMEQYIKWKETEQ